METTRSPDQAELTADSALVAVKQSLRKAYEDVPIHIGKMPLHADKPFFTVEQKKLINQPQMQSRMQRTYTMEVKYYPSEEEKQDYMLLYVIGHGLLSALQAIYLEDMLPIYAGESRLELTEHNNVRLKIKYQINTKIEREKGPEMRQLRETTQRRN